MREEDAKLIYGLCMELWRSQLIGTDAPSVRERFEEMNREPRPGDFVFADSFIFWKKSDCRKLFGILEETVAYGDYIVRLWDGTLQRWENMGIHRLYKEVADLAEPMFAAQGSEG